MGRLKFDGFLIMPHCFVIPSERMTALPQCIKRSRTGGCDTRKMQQAIECLIRPTLFAVGARFPVCLVCFGGVGRITLSDHCTTSVGTAVPLTITFISADGWSVSSYNYLRRKACTTAAQPFAMQSPLAALECKLTYKVILISRFYPTVPPVRCQAGTVAGIAWGIGMYRGYFRRKLRRRLVGASLSREATSSSRVSGQPVRPLLLPAMAPAWMCQRIPQIAEPAETVARTVIIAAGDCVLNPSSRIMNAR